MIPKPDNSTTKKKVTNKNNNNNNDAALFTIAKKMKQIKWPSRDKWIKKIHTHTHTHTHTMEYYSAIKNNHAIFRIMDGLRGYYAKWNKSGKKKDKCHMISLIVES